MAIVIDPKKLDILVNGLMSSKIVDTADPVDSFELLNILLPLCEKEIDDDNKTEWIR